MSVIDETWIAHESEPPCLVFEGDRIATFEGPDGDYDGADLRLKRARLAAQAPAMARELSRLLTGAVSRFDIQRILKDAGVIP
jgi:hypothetical protein